MLPALWLWGAQCRDKNQLCLPQPDTCLCLGSSGPGLDKVSITRFSLVRSRASLSSQFSRCFTAHNKWTWCHEAHSLDSLNKVWETEIKTFFAQLTQPDHQRVYPGGVNGRISENLWENTKKWRAADSSDGQNKQIDRELRRDLKRAFKQLCKERVMSWAFLFGYHLKSS